MTAQTNKGFGYFPLILMLVGVVVITLLCVVSLLNKENVYINTKVKDTSYAGTDFFRYHKYKYCSTLMFSGEGDVIEISKSEAENMGREGCSDCYPEWGKIREEREQRIEQRKDEIRRMDIYINNPQRFKIINNKDASEYLKNYYKYHTDILESYDIEIWKDTLSTEIMYRSANRGKGKMPSGIKYESYKKIINESEKQDTIYSRYKMFYENAKYEDKLLAEGKEYELINIIELREGNYQKALKQYRESNDAEYIDIYLDF